MKANQTIEAMPGRAWACAAFALLSACGGGDPIDPGGDVTGSSDRAARAEAPASATGVTDTASVAMAASDIPSARTSQDPIQQPTAARPEPPPGDAATEQGTGDPVYLLGG